MLRPERSLLLVFTKGKKQARVGFFTGEPSILFKQGVNSLWGVRRGPVVLHWKGTPCWDRKCWTEDANNLPFFSFRPKKLYTASFFFHLLLHSFFYVIYRPRFLKCQIPLVLPRGFYMAILIYLGYWYELLSPNQKLNFEFRVRYNTIYISPRLEDRVWSWYIIVHWKYDQARKYGRKEFFLNMPKHFFELPVWLNDCLRFLWTRHMDDDVGIVIFKDMHGVDINKLSIEWKRKLFITGCTSMNKTKMH